MIFLVKSQTAVFWILFLSFLTAGANAFELEEHSASYTANIKKGVSIKGKAVRSLKRLKENTWQYRFDVKSFAADIDESVTFTVSDNSRLVPHHYHYHLSPFLARDRKASLTFDWKANTVTNMVKKDAWHISDIPINTYDRLSYQLQLLLDVSQNKLPIDYEIAHKRKLRDSRFDTAGEELIETALGPAAAIIVKKVRSKSNKRDTTLWVSKDYPLLLLKMVQIEKDGEAYEIQIEKASVAGKEISFSRTQETPKPL